MTGLAVSQLAARARKLKVIAITDEGYLAQIHQTAALAQSARSPDAVVDHVRDQLIGLLDLAGSRFEYGSLLGHPPRLEPDGTVDDGPHPVGRRAAGLPGEEIELRTFGNGQYYGRFMLTPKPGAGRPCRPAWSPSRWPIRSGAPSAPQTLPGAGANRGNSGRDRLARHRINMRWAIGSTACFVIRSRIRCTHVAADMA